MSCVKELDGEISLSRLRNQCDFGYKYLQNVSQQNSVSPVFSSPCKDGTSHCSESQHSENRSHIFQDQFYFDSPTHVNVCCEKTRGEINLQEMTANSEERSYLTTFQEQNYRQFFQQQFSNFSHQRQLSDFALKSSLTSCAPSYSDTNKMVPPPAHQGPPKFNPQQQQELAKTYRIEKYSEQQQHSNELFNSDKAEKLKFPWMKTTKSHAKQWKSNWMGLCSTIKFKIYCMVILRKK